MTKNGRLMRRSRLEESNQDETMLIVASHLPFAHFMDQSKPAALENDRLGAAAELLGRGRGRGLRDRR